MKLINHAPASRCLLWRGDRAQDRVVCAGYKKQDMAEDVVDMEGGKEIAKSRDRTWDT